MLYQYPAPPGENCGLATTVFLFLHELESRPGPTRLPQQALAGPYRLNPRSLALKLAE